MIKKKNHCKLSMLTINQLHELFITLHTECITKLILFSVVNHKSRDNPSPVNQQYFSEWNSWSACSEPCGYGVRARKRSCQNPHVLLGGNTCRGALVQHGFCFVRACPGRCGNTVLEDPLTFLVFFYWPISVNNTKCTRFWLSDWTIVVVRLNGLLPDCWWIEWLID